MMDLIKDYLTYWQNPYLRALFIVFGAIVAAWIVDVITCRLFLRLTSKTQTTLDDEVVGALHRPLFVSVVLVGAAFALREISTSRTVLFIGDGFAITAAVVVWSLAAKRIGHAVLGSLASHAQAGRMVQESTLPLFDIMLKVVVFAGAAYAVLLAWKVNVTAWLASAGVIGIAVGFAAKDTLSNLFSGIFILTDRPYKIGDYIVLDSGERGMVSHIGIRTTRIMTRDDIQIIVPNAIMGNAKIANETGGHDPKERVRVNVGVSYGSDIDKVRAVLTEIAAQSPYICDEPTPRVRFRELGDSSLNFQLLGWIEEPALRGRAIDQLLDTIYKRFRAEKIEIPFPQRDLHVKSGTLRSA